MENNKPIKKDSSSKSVSKRNSKQDVKEVITPERKQSRDTKSQGMDNLVNGIGDNKKSAQSSIDVGYVTVSPEKKLMLLYTLLTKNKNKKVVVFFSSPKEVEFYNLLLSRLELPVRTIKPSKDSKGKDNIILCTTDTEIDLSDKDKVIQYSPHYSKDNDIYH
jgi:hypothetical protein